MIFSVGLYGEIHKNEARRWFNSLRRYASTYACPFYAVINLNSVTFIGTRARIQFANATSHPQLKGLIFIASEPHIQKAAHMIQMLAQPGSIHTFESTDDARRFAEQQFSDILWV